MPQSKMKSHQPSLESYRPEHVIVAMAPDESADSMNAALLRLGVPLSSVTYLPIQTPTDFATDRVGRRIAAVRAEKGEVAVLVEPTEHFVPGMSGRWPVGVVTDEMYAWKAASIKRLLETRQTRSAPIYTTVTSGYTSQGTGSAPVIESTLLATQPGGERVLDGWQNDDEFFVQHPHATFRLRGVIPGEFGSMQRYADDARVLAVRFPTGEQMRMVLSASVEEQDGADIAAELRRLWHRDGAQALYAAFKDLSFS